MLYHDRRFDVPTDNRTLPLTETLSEWIGEDVLSARLLNGGFHNQNIRITTASHTGPLALRLCQCPGWMLRREIALCDHARARVPTPTCIRHGEVPSSNLSWGIFEWIDGEPMHVALSRHATAKERQALFWSCGEVLAKLHALTFDGSGFFNETLRIDEPFESIGQAFWRYMCQCLEDPKVQARLGKTNTEKTLKTLAKHKGLLFQLEHQRTLVHSDFNTKNIFVHRAAPTTPWTIRAVMDWEFAFSGSPMCDIGNFLRFEEDVSVTMVEAFVEGYQHSATHKLPNNWRTIARVLDITALLNMLTRDVLGSKTQHTATNKIIDYVERLQ